MRPHARPLTVTLALAFAALACGCSSVVVRENIISTVNTGVGLSLTENPQTQLYEVRAGYIRSQFYSIPTGKRVECAACTENGDASGCVHSNEAGTTPEIVSGIRMKSGIEHLLVGMEVSESFAVGSEAVRSDAATAMYIANAKNPKQAEAAARALSGVFDPATMNRMADINELRSSGSDGEKAAINEAVQGLSGKGWADFVRTANPADWQELTRILTRRGVLSP